MRSLHCNVHFSVRLTYELCLQHGEKRSCSLEASKQKVQITDKFLDGVFLGIKDGSEEFIVVTLAGCVVCRTVERRLHEDAADPVFFHSICGTSRRLLPDDVPREPRAPKEQPLRIDVRPVRTDLPLPINTEPSKPREIQSSRPGMGTLLDALAV